MLSTAVFPSPKNASSNDPKRKAQITNSVTPALPPAFSHTTVRPGRRNQRGIALGALNVLSNALYKLALLLHLRSIRTQTHDTSSPCYDYCHHEFRYLWVILGVLVPFFTCGNPRRTIHPKIWLWIRWRLNCTFPFSVAVARRQ